MEGPRPQGWAPHQESRCWVGLGGLLGGFDGDAESECFDLVSEAAGVRLRAPTLEPVSTEVLVRDVTVDTW
jgi:hypothetical protein